MYSVLQLLLYYGIMKYVYALKGGVCIQYCQLLVCLSTVRGHCGMKNFYQSGTASDGWGGTLFRSGNIKLSRKYSVSPC